MLQFFAETIFFVRSMHLQSMDNLINYFTCIIYTVSVFVSTPGACIIKLFAAVIYGFS
jgi:hypothetical protein